MKKTRFTETRIVAVLKEADAGMKVKDLCRKHGVSEPTYYNWKSKYGGMVALRTGHRMRFTSTACLCQRRRNPQRSSYPDRKTV